MRKRSARAIRGVLNRFGAGLDVRREQGKLHLEFKHPRLPGPEPDPGALPRLLHDPVDALFHHYGGKPAAFVCPLERCVDINGLNFSASGWHPFVATLREYADGVRAGYEGSALQHYYARFQPDNLREALIGLPGDADDALHRLPSHLTYFYPWSAKSVAEADELIKAACHRDSVEHGRPDITLDEHGFKGHGPVSAALMQLEFERLTRVYDSLATSGYRREYGDVRVLMVKRGPDYRFILSGGGLHRAAAMKALGYNALPATFNNTPTVFDADDIPRWRQVVDGVWSADSARAYVDHLFDFDAQTWAERQRLASGAQHRRPDALGTARARLPEIA